MRTPRKTTSVRETVYNTLVTGIVVATVTNLVPDLGLLWKIVVVIVGVAVVHLVVALLLLVTLLLTRRRDRSRSELQEVANEDDPMSPSVED